MSNLTQTDEAWQSLDTSGGFVALEKGQQNLLPSEPFPWDSSKEVYLLNGFHGLHCLVRTLFLSVRRKCGLQKQRVIYISIRQFQRNETQRYEFSHILHCLDALRADVTCAADDTPLCLGPQAQEDAARLSQTRRCRDWSQLEDWANENSACFEGLEPSDPRHETIEEWRNCPERSPYRSVVDAYFSKSSAAKRSAR